MHRTARTVPGTGSARPRVAVLAAVVLALLVALGIAGPPPGATVEPVAGAVAGADRHGNTGPRGDGGCGSVCAEGPDASGSRADDGCGTLCAVRAATRPESHSPSEHPAPRGHLATCAPGTDVTPPGVGGLLPAPTVHTSSSDPHALHDRGRAPPATSGI